MFQEMTTRLDGLTKKKETNNREGLAGFHPENFCNERKKKQASHGPPDTGAAGPSIIERNREEDGASNSYTHAQASSYAHDSTRTHMTLKKKKREG